MRTKNKKIQIRLDQESAELLNTLSLRFNNSKSEIIRKALRCMAGKNHHIMTIKYEQKNEQNYNEQDIEEAIKIAKTKWIDK